MTEIEQGLDSQAGRELPASSHNQSTARSSVTAMGVGPTSMSGGVDQPRNPNKRGRGERPLGERLGDSLQTLPSGAREWAHAHDPRRVELEGQRTLGQLIEGIIMRRTRIAGRVEELEQ